MTARAPFLLAACLAAAAPAQTLEPPGAVGQIAPAATPADDARSRQIGTATRDVTVADTPRARESAPLPQIAAPRDAAPPAQLTGAGKTARATPQLSDGPASAQPAAQLSTRKEGRTAAVTRVEGRDRCDPAAAKPGPACRNVIEARGRDFPPPTAEPLSPEQRLLVERRPLDTQGDQAGGIARTASRGREQEANANQPTMQGLASVVLGTQAPAPPAATDPAAGLTPDQAAIATSVLGALNGTTP